jgi:hypothetical protein
MYMDMYRLGDLSWSRFDSENDYLWAGIRFVPPHEPTEAWYRLSAWRGMCLLDQKLVEKYSDTLPKKIFSYLPDVTEVVLPREQSSLVKQIIDRSAGRKIVFLGGSIGGQKNLALWYSMIEGADPNKWFFVQIGEIYHGTLELNDTAALNCIGQKQPENLLIHDRYLTDDAEFNDVIRSSFAIYAIYRNFTISSNMLGKAAHFQKPILVSDRFLMGSRVMKYGIGLAVNENNPELALKALEALSNMHIPPEYFASYCHDFGIDALSKELNSFLLACME